MKLANETALVANRGLAKDLRGSDLHAFLTEAMRGYRAL